MHSFFLAPEHWTAQAQGCELVLQGGEATHLIKVLRLKPGEPALVLDGAGRTALVRVRTVEKRQAVLCVEQITQHPRPASAVVLAAGWGKAARRGWIIEKAVELEAAGLWLWQAERSQFPVPEDIKENWQAQLVAGAKQCQNPWLPELRTLTGGVRELAAAGQGFEHKYLLVEADYAPDAFLDESRLGLPGRTLLVVGPEGGFTPAEVSALRLANFTALSLGERVLRWETAAMMALGLNWWKREYNSFGAKL